MPKAAMQCSSSAWSNASFSSKSCLAKACFRVERSVSAQENCRFCATNCICASTASEMRPFLAFALFSFLSMAAFRPRKPMSCCVTPSAEVRRDSGSAPSFSSSFFSATHSALTSFHQVLALSRSTCRRSSKGCFGRKLESWNLRMGISSFGLPVTTTGVTNCRPPAPSTSKALAFSGSRNFQRSSWICCSRWYSSLHLTALWRHLP
mmetsp:Transcript_116879/g.372124  ORF Transcript_116879/g.372124 Transcript_116879/m.372124 type:complete len:207 (+) Transcript_116879:1912-2532(+)